MQTQVASGVGYGAIGGATSALIAPYLVSAAGGVQNLTDGQRAAIVGISTLLGGVTSGLAGQNAAAGANAATNESLNNSTNPEDIAHGKDLIPLEGGVGGGAGIGGPGGGEEIFPDAPPESVGDSADAGGTPVTTTSTSPATSTTSQGATDPGTGANDWNDAASTTISPSAALQGPADYGNPSDGWDSGATNGVGGNAGLPLGYTMNSDGTITGPGGGQLTIVATDGSGAPIFQRLSSSGSPTSSFFSVDSVGNQAAVPSPLANGNSYSSGPTTLYGFYDSEGSFLKWGISNAPDSRYTASELNGGNLDAVATFDQRSLAASIERYLSETQPGPLNLEPWAGKAAPGNPNYDPSYIPKGTPPQ